MNDARSDSKPEPGQQDVCDSEPQGQPAEQQDDERGARRRALEAGVQAPRGRGRPHAPGSMSTATGLQGKSDEVSGSIATDPRRPPTPTAAPTRAVLRSRSIRRPSDRPRFRGPRAVAVYVLSQPGAAGLLRPLRVAGRRLPARPDRIAWPVADGAVPQRLLPGRLCRFPEQPGLRPRCPSRPCRRSCCCRSWRIFGLATNARAGGGGPGRHQRGALLARCSTRVTTTVARRSWRPLFYGFGTVAWYAAMLGTPGSWPTSWRRRSCSWPSPRRSTPSAADGASTGTRRAIARAGSIRGSSWRGCCFGIGRAGAPDRRSSARRSSSSWAAAAPGPARGRQRGSGRASRGPPAGLQPRHDRPRLPPGLRVPLPDRVPAAARSSIHPEWGIEDPRYIPRTPLIMLALAARRRSSTTGCADRLRPRPLLDPELPGRPARPDRHEHPADQPGLPAGHPGHPRRAGADGSWRAPCSRSAPSRSSTSCTSARAGSSSAIASATTSRRSRMILVTLGIARLGVRLVDGRPGGRLDRHQRLGRLLGRHLGW